MAFLPQLRIPATYMRGGTSKGVFFRLQDLPAFAQAPGKARDALLVRLRAEAIVGPTGLEDEIRRHLALHQDKLAQYREIEARDFPGGAPTERGAALQHVVLRGGIRYENQWVELLTDALEVLARPVPESAG